MQLHKGLGPLQVFAIASGAMISSGLFILPGLAYAKAGPAVVFSYLVAGVLAACGMLSVAELATAMPRAGGDYFYVKRGMGPAAGTIIGLLNWFSLSLKSAFALIGLGAVAVVVTGIDGRLVGLAGCVLFLLVNLRGVRVVARVQVALIFAVLALVAVYAVKALSVMEVAHFDPLVPHGAGSVFATAGFVFVAYGGLLKIASVAEEIERPERTIPLAMILSLLVAAAVYVLAIAATIGAVHPELLAGSLTPIGDAARVLMGAWGGRALGLAAVLAFTSAANAGILAASRYLLALSRDELLPAAFGRVGHRFQTPHFALVATTLCMAAFLFLNIDLLVKAASAVLIMSCVLSMLAVIIMRESMLQNYQPRFKAPFYPWLQIVGVLGLVYLLVQMGGVALLVSGALVVLAFLVYWFYGRARAGREYALLHIIERVTARELVSRTLESELKDIIRVRDGIVRDRFDHMVENAAVLDIQQRLDLEGLTALVAEELGPRVSVDRRQLYQQLLDREREDSTALSPTLAVPHVVIEGEGKFDVLIARCREGISFSTAAPAVVSVFVIVGTRDERNFHLRTLAAIAQIAQESHFERRWRAARDAEALRDLVLLGRRQRH